MSLSSAGDGVWVDGDDDDEAIVYMKWITWLVLCGCYGWLFIGLDK